MAQHGTHSGVRKLAPSQAWQLPTLLVAVAIFGYAAYLFIDPQPGPSVADRIGAARELIKQERAEASIEVLNKLLKTEKLERPKQGEVHLLLARSLELGMAEAKYKAPVNYEQIIKQTQYALQCDVELGAADYRRLAVAHESLGNAKEALANYRHAMSLDRDRELALNRKVIELLMDDGQTESADQEIANYLDIPDVADAERSWALGARAQIQIDRGELIDARATLGQAEKYGVETNQTLQGELAYRLGYAAWKGGDLADGERQFLLARQLLGVSHQLDADAAFGLAMISISNKQIDAAMAYLQSVMVSHPDSKSEPLARLQRGILRARAGEHDAALEDFSRVVKQIDAKKSLEKLREQASEQLVEAETLFTNAGKLGAAIEILAHEQALTPQPATPFFARLANVLEKRAAQLAEEAESLSGGEKVKRLQKFRETLARAGAAYITLSNKLVLTDDQAYADALWKGIDCYDRSGDTPAAIGALEIFVAERPNDSLTPEAILRLGRTYQAAGMIDKAIAAYQHNQFRYPTSLAASKSAVPLAQAYISKGPDGYTKAEQVLISVLDNNPMLTPDSNEFRQALFELGQLLYRMGRYEESLAKLEEFATRYPNDKRQVQLKFAMADSYRKSAAAIGDTLAAFDAGKLEPAANGKLVDRVEMVVARRDRLRKARGLYDEVVEIFRDDLPTADMDQLQLKLAHFYRADCLFDLLDYDQAIKFYDIAARRYQNDPSALAAYVQIVNSYVALNKPNEARAANERAKWMLRRIPPEAFGESSFNISRQYWEQWLGFAGESGLWAKQVASGQ